MTNLSHRDHLTGLLLSFAIAACGSTDESSEKNFGELPQVPEILAFVASAAEITAGESATLSWTTRNAGSLALADHQGQQIFSLADLGVETGAVEVWPEETTSYTLVAFGEADSSRQALRTVTIQIGIEPVDAPTIESFEASAAQVAVGGDVTLSWSTANATSLVLGDDAGGVIDVSDAPVTAGSVVVQPVRSPTVYSLIATGAGGRATALVSVEVIGLPRVHRFFLQPVQPVAAGEPILLLWETSRANHVVIRDDAGATVVDTVTEVSGSRTLHLDRSIGFQLTATGDGGKADATVLAQVAPKILAFAVSSDDGREDDPITLTWQTSGAEAAVLTGPDGYRLEVPEAQLAIGSAITTLKASGDYVLTARAGAVTQTWSVFVRVTEAPRIRSLTSNPALLTAAADHPGQVALSYVQDGGSTCTLYNGRVAIPGRIGFACKQSDTIEVALTGTSDLRLVAKNHAGSHEAVVRVVAVEPARVLRFTKTPTRRLNPGSDVELAWDITGAERVEMTRRPVDAGGGGEPETPVDIGENEFSGTRTTKVHADTVFTLRAANSLGDLTSVELPVLAGKPVISRFEVAPRVAAPDDPISFTWSCDGGDTLELRDEHGNVLKTSTEPAVIDHGSVSNRAPATPQTIGYRLTIQNDAPDPAKAEIELLVTDGPLVRSLTASAPKILVGSTVDITWEVSDDIHGQKPTLTLTDNFENVYALPTNYNPNSGKVTITPPGEGRFEFTLTATTTDTRSSSTDVDPAVVEVMKDARIHEFKADPEIVFTRGGADLPNVTLSWRTEHAVELQLGEADANGQAIPGTTFHRLALEGGDTQGELDAGSFDVQPLVTTHYVLRATNGVGTTFNRALKVVVDPPRVVSFVADPPDILPGESTTLAWYTENTTAAMLEPMQWVITPVDNAFVDISGLPGARQIPLSANDSFETFFFPDEFRFPFDGQLHVGVRVMMNGFLTFFLDDARGTGANQSKFPTAAIYNQVHLAPYWDNLQAYTTGKLFWHYDYVARTVTVMWKNWSYRDPNAPFDMNFEVVLHENGSFEYRYGTMYGGRSGSGTEYSYYANAGMATIGFQDTRNSTGALVHYGNGSSQIYPGGMSNRGWFFDLAAPPIGNRQVTPASSQTYTLVAANRESSVEAETSVRVWTAPVSGPASIYPSDPEVGEPFTVSWRNTNASRVRILLDSSKVLCESTSTPEALQGSCTITLHDAGDHSVIVEAINGIERNVVTQALSLAVYPPLQIESLTVSKSLINSGDEVTVTWQGLGGFRAELYACVPYTNRGACQKLDIDDQPANAGTYTTTPTASAEFWLRLMDRSSRSKEASVNVWVDPPRIEHFEAIPKQIPAGAPATLEWITTGGSTAPKVDGLPPRAPTELSGAEFLDISSSGTPVPMTGSTNSGFYTFDFPEGFTFEYFGTRYSALQATTDGWATFNTTNTTTYATNNSMPTSSSYATVHLAPFWDALTQKSTGGVRYELRTHPIDGRFLIVQWTGFQFDTTSYNSADLNFQILLYESGFVEYRFGNMTSEASTQTNREMAHGRSATIGLQAPDVSFGQTVLHNLTTTPPPLTDRSFRFQVALPEEGTATVVPTETTTYRLCVTNASLYNLCKEVKVVVIKAGDILISELMIAPDEPSAEWFEIRNLGPDPIDLAGFILVSGTEEYPIPAETPLPVAPNDFAVLSRSANPAVDPLHVYGSAIDLGNDPGELQLHFESLVVDKVTWGAGWPIEANHSIAFEPSFFDRKEAANNDVSAWCSSTEVYDGALHGSPGALGTGCRRDGGFRHYVVDSCSGLPFIDIAPTGTSFPNLFATSPYYTSAIPLGFSFPYFGDAFAEITINKYGMLTVGGLTGTLPAANSAIPSATTLPNGIIAPMWDAMYDRGTAIVSYELLRVGDQRVMVVQWTNVTPTANQDYGLATFQAQLWENGDIVLAYDGAVKSANSSYMNYQYIYGSGSTIGIESPDGNEAIQLFYGNAQDAGAPAYDGRSYRFIPR